MNRRAYIIAVFLIIILLPFLTAALNMYADYFFFKETGYTAVFTKMLFTKAAAAVAAALIFLGFMLVNVIAANKIDFPRRDTVVIDGVIHQLKAMPFENLVKPLSLIAAVALSFFALQWGGFRWAELLIFTGSIPVGISDPIIGNDAGFYMFRLPLIESLKGFAGFTIITSAAVVAVSYFLRGGIVITERSFNIDLRVRKHFGILAGLYMAHLALGFYLNMLGLMFSEHGIVFGASYTDIHAKLFSYKILIAAAIVSAVIVTAGALKGSLRLMLIPSALLFLIYISGIIAYPSILQKLKVAPNEQALESPFIKNNINFTRTGYDLDRIEVRPFDVDYSLTGADIEKNDATIKNIRLWDHAPLLRTYSQLQQIRTYYRFADVDNDRYEINGRYMQVMLSPRELSYNDLPSRTWINERLVFTHGYGIAMGPVSRISREGLPEFIVKDIPPVSDSTIKVARPEIYYGEMSNDYVIVRTKAQEFSYPTTEGNIYTSYEGSGGVRLDSFIKKLFFSVKFKTEKIILSSDITGESRILYYRNVIERVKKIAPFLVIENDPYVVIGKDGRLSWIVDAYTVSDKFPYSTPVDRSINYIRNSVKIVVDAYDGSVDFYVSDDKDAVLKVYSGLFPSLFKPIEKMPEDIRKHIRYPQRFLQLQASMFASYHMTDPNVFYNKENLWEIPSFEQKKMEPYYTIMKLPGEKKEEYILLLPYTPAKRDNLAAWLAARCDEPHYGKLVVYTFPRDRLVYGPKQVDARINQDSYISQQLTLWGQRGSQVIRGSLLVIPIERSLLYVQPLYLSAADKAGLPELRRVIAAYENDVVMEENLELALQRLFGGKKAVAASRLPAAAEASPPPSNLAREAMRIYDRALEMQRRGDWAGYGQELKKLEEILKLMAR